MENVGRAKVLLVDDNPRVRSFVRPALEDAGYNCIEAEDGLTALDMVDLESPDLVVLDIMLSDDPADLSGLDVCKKIREKGLRIPVVFLTIKDRLDDPRYMEQAFRLGGDDYISKREELQRVERQMGLSPTEFLERKGDTEELVARVKARLPQVASVHEFDDYLRVDLDGQRVQVMQAGEWNEVHLAPKEFVVLGELLKSGGRPVGVQRLMGVADIQGTESALQNLVYKLRQKLEPDPQSPRYILTYHKIGYRFHTDG
ncbi:MAG: response regulator transcription factor [Dehalococcoidia bacterium]